MIPLTDEENKSYKKQKVCYICKKEFSTDDDNEKYHKVRDHYYYIGEFRGPAHSICNLRDKTPIEIPVVFHKVLRMIIILQSNNQQKNLIANAQEKIQKNTLLLQYQLKKN